jgi:hypothetical protein
MLFKIVINSKINKLHGIFNYPVHPKQPQFQNLIKKCPSQDFTGMTLVGKALHNNEFFGSFRKCILHP